MLTIPKPSIRTENEKIVYKRCIFGFNKSKIKLFMETSQ